MARAMTLAKRGAGKTSPNPLVGAVAAKDGVIIGEGWHRQYGGKHAEAEALDAALAAGLSVKGADIYCTLEPCCFTSPQKHQPPCTGLLIKNGIRRAVIACLDPNPLVNGQGAEKLRRAGIVVESGLLEREGEALNEGFFTFQRLGRPFVRLKIAQSLDGRIACASGDSRWITDEAARKIVHGMRARHDAVLVGRGTVIADDPELTVRLARGRNPLRVVLDSRLSVLPAARIFSLPDVQKTVIVCGKDADPQKAELLRGTGARVIQIDLTRGGAPPLRRAELSSAPCGAESSRRHPSLAVVLDALADIGVRSILVEGGSGVYTSFLREGLWDKLTVFAAPLVLGEGISATGDLGITRVSDALRLRDVSVKTIGSQVMIEGARSTPGAILSGSAVSA
jgi:diaminohydroxyphosphoribosylaminopyrimidine deaminase/5-amino-6-(5-phosphoribosylamino)uracil reductase